MKKISIEAASGRGVAARWKEQYYDRKNIGSKWMDTVSGSSREKYDILCSLGENPSIEKVAEVIGNKSWSYISCDCCCNEVERAVRIRTDYDDGKAYCFACVEEAHTAIKP